MSYRSTAWPRNPSSSASSRCTARTPHSGYATTNLLLGDAPTESVPEPGTYILCGAALLALGLHRRASVK